MKFLLIIWFSASEFAQPAPLGEFATAEECQAAPAQIIAALQLPAFAGARWACIGKTFAAPDYSTIVTELQAIKALLSAPVTVTGTVTTTGGGVTGPLDVRVISHSEPMPIYVTKPIQVQQ